MKSSTAQRWLVTWHMVGDMHRLSQEVKDAVRADAERKLKELGWVRVQGHGFKHEKSLKKIRSLPMP